MNIEGLLEKILQFFSQFDVRMIFFRVDKIIIRCNPVIKVVATDNWIIKISPYKLNFAHQSDATLVVVSSDTHVYIPGRPEGGQFLNIEVKPNRPNVPSFQIRYVQSKKYYMK